MGKYKMLTGDAIVAAKPLMVRITAPDCPLKGRRGDLRLYRCICYDNKICEHFLAFSFVQGKRCVKCLHPGAEDAEEFEGWLEK